MKFDYFNVEFCNFFNVKFSANFSNQRTKKSGKDYQWSEMNESISDRTIIAKDFTIEMHENLGLSVQALLTDMCYYMYNVNTWLMILL